VGVGAYDVLGKETNRIKEGPSQRQHVNSVVASGQGSGGESGLNTESDSSTADRVSDRGQRQQSTATPSEGSNRNTEQLVPEETKHEGKLEEHKEGGSGMG